MSTANLPGTAAVPYALLCNGNQCESLELSYFQLLIQGKVQGMVAPALYA